MINIGIIGATGYTGIELLRILKNHPKAQVRYATTETYAGQALQHTYPHLKQVTDLSGEKLDIAKVIACCDVVFIALPHGHAAAIAAPLLAAGKKVIDLGGDLRLKNPADYQHWYQHTPADTELLTTAVYGLPEAGWRDSIAKSTLVANPGCYATAAILAAAPLITTEVIDIYSGIFDGKSGVSGAGRTLSLNTHLCETTENFKAYQPGGTHRHVPEIEQALSTISGKPLTLEFTPHLVPMIRGLFMTAYFQLLQEVSTAQIRAMYQAYYESSPFVRLLPPSELAQTKHVRGTNYCDIAIFVNPRTKRLMVTSVIDNLGKGAAGQAVQNMNLMCQLPEEMGLDTLHAMYP